jgi:hypothetical protein
VLEHIADTKGLSQYADYMRAYLGDVIINYADNQYYFDCSFVVPWN